MDFFKSFKQKVIYVNHSSFEDLAIEIFKFQADKNPIYAKYINFLGKKPEKINSVKEIPFLPIEFFKHHRVITEYWEPTIYFESSGTTGSQPSTHYLRDLDFYLNHAKRTFEEVYGPINTFRILALLPSYLERKHSSLIAMISSFIEEAVDGSGFYLGNYENLRGYLEDKRQKTILWGVTFALLEMAESYPIDLSEFMVIETGGMKGRREEITRNELHTYLKNSLNIDEVHAEYGMTELLSQAYGANGIFKPGKTMKIQIRDINDPFENLPPGKTGGINVIDLANIHSCSFIETKDLGRLYPDGSFEVLGRFDNSDLRGCNLMI